MLTDFFRINMPYGIERNDKGEWTCFNREYLPLGWNSIQFQSVTNEFNKNFPVYSAYKALSEEKLFKLASNDENHLQRDKEGKIVKVFLYHDGSNPANVNNASNWKLYFEKLKILGQLQLDTKITRVFPFN